MSHRRDRGKEEESTAGGEQEQMEQEGVDY